MGEVLIAHAEPIRPATMIRSTLLQSSVATLRTRGHFEAWYALMDPRYRTDIVESLAPSWMPIEVAFAHYEACEALGLPLQEQVALGETVSERLQGTFMATLLRSSGLNPLVLFRQFDRMWARVFQGGSVQLTQEGPKDVAVDIRGCPLTRYPYFRVAFTGVVRAAFVLSATKTYYVKQKAYNANTQAFVMHAAWV